MNKLKAILLLFVALLTLPAAAQLIPQLPIDEAVRYGKLHNGLTYYIRHNALPENRVNLYIAQKVGSVQEEENQRGLAHFLEHMCFNGTDNFPDNSLVKYCESIGVKFGENLNAYTSTDETVYNIDNVPVTESNIDSCLLILHDWADGLTLDPKEIDKERGVIHEEWRMRSSASGRIFERNLPTLYPGSRYGNRYPIGLMSVVDNFKPEELRAYYEKWYRPDLQGLIIVGDIDVDQVEAKIKALFSSIKMPENPAQYEHYPVPSNEQPIYVIDKDKEQTMGVVQLMFKHDPIPEEYKNTIAKLQVDYFTALATSAFNARLEELSQNPDCPFTAAGCEDGNYIMSKTMDAFTIFLLPKAGRDAEAIKTIAQEIKRASEFGFTGTEINRADQNFLSRIEKIYDNRDKQYNDFYVQQYVRHFLENVPIPDLETEYETYKQFSQILNQQQALTPTVSELFKEYTASTDSNFVVLAMYPEKEGVAIPTVDEFKKAIAEGKAAEVEAYVDNVKSEPLVPQLPKKVKIAKETPADFGYTCWTLSNGARVYFKQTDFNKSQVNFQATSLGGKSKIDTKDFVNMSLFNEAMSSTGVGNFTYTELQKKLAGKQVSCNPVLGDLTENLNGTSTPKDLRTLFELIYLRFQKPADDPDGYNSFIALQKTQLENADKEPMTAFMDSINATVFGHNPRKRSLHVNDLAQANYETIKKLYSERYASAGDFDFFFTGAFDVDSLREFTEQYIAPLPGVKKREQYVDLNLYPVSGVHNNHFRRQMETPQSNIIQLWSGAYPYSLKNEATVNALASILTKRYLKTIREDAGIAYSVGSYGSLGSVPRSQYTIQTFAPVKPAKLDSALLLMRQAIEDIAEKGVTSDELDEVAKFKLKEYADNQKKNGYWFSLIYDKVLWNEDKQTGQEEAIKGVTSDDVKQFAKEVLLKQNNCCTISILPEDFTEKENTK